MRGKKMWAVVLCIVAGVVLLGVGTAMAWSMYTKSLDAQGRMDFTNEVTVTEIRVVSMTEVSVTVDSTADTQGGVTYDVRLYLDRVEAGTSPQTTSWASQDTGGGSPVTVSFTGLDLATVIALDVEVGH